MILQAAFSVKLSDLPHFDEKFVGRNWYRNLGYVHSQPSSYQELHTLFIHSQKPPA
jgi:hypothetical protein